MIAKKYRLTEKEVKKVLARRKPFFGRILIANTAPNRVGHARLGVILSSKQTKGSVNRNSFRRLFYDSSRDFLTETPLDILFLVKKGTILRHTDALCRVEIEQDLRYLWKNILRSTKSG